MPSYNSLIAIHIYPTTIQYESRIFRMTEALAERQDVQRIVIYGFPGEDLPAAERLNSKTEIHRVGRVSKGTGTLGKIWRFLGWYVAVTRSARKISPNVVNCHSLSVFPVAWLVAMLNRARLIYEPHELETETATMHGKRKLVAKGLERALIRSAELVLVVSESIAQAYRDEYKLHNVHVIKNAPPRMELSDVDRVSIISFRKLFDIPSDDIVFLYQGALEEGRGVRALLEAFSNGVGGRHIVFMGFGVLENEIKSYANKVPNIHFHPAVPAKDVLRYTLGADVGIAYLDRSCINHEYALPNKFFQYLHSGKPVLCTDLIEMGRIVSHYRVGWRMGTDVDSIRSSVNAITMDEIRRCSANVPKAVADLNWDAEKRKLNDIYDDFIRKHAR